jgi:hypothetical protein
MAIYRFMTGSWYEIDLPDNKVDTEGYLPEDLYEAYFDGCLPDDVQVYEVEVDHIWDN